jgi:adenylylsulfate reductase, subunit A
MRLDDDQWHCFTLSRYDARTGSRAMEKAPVYPIFD